MGGDGVGVICGSGIWRNEAGIRQCPSIAIFMKSKFVLLVYFCNKFINVFVVFFLTHFLVKGINSIFLFPFFTVRAISYSGK